MTYHPDRTPRGWIIRDEQGLWALDISNKVFATEADAKTVILEHESGIRKGHWDARPGLLDDEGHASS